MYCSFGTLSLEPLPTGWWWIRAWLWEREIAPQDIVILREMWEYLDAIVLTNVWMILQGNLCNLTVVWEISSSDIKINTGRVTEKEYKEPSLSKWATRRGWNRKNTNWPRPQSSISTVYIYIFPHIHFKVRYIYSKAAIDLDLPRSPATWTVNELNPGQQELLTRWTVWDGVGPTDIGQLTKLHV